jgi:hypothetical protein
MGRSSALDPRPSDITDPADIFLTLHLKRDGSFLPNSYQDNIAALFALVEAASGGFATLRPAGAYNAATTYVRGDIVADADAKLYIWSDPAPAAGVDLTDSRWLFWFDAQPPAEAGSGGIEWQTVTADTNVANQNGYLASSTSLITFTLPASPTVNDAISIAGAGAGGWRLEGGTIFDQQGNSGDSLATIGTFPRASATVVCINAAQDRWQLVTPLIGVRLPDPRATAIVEQINTILTGFSEAPLSAVRESAIRDRVSALDSLGKITQNLQIWHEFIGGLVSNNATAQQQIDRLNWSFLMQPENLTFNGNITFTPAADIAHVDDGIQETAPAAANVNTGANDASVNFYFSQYIYEIPRSGTVGVSLAPRIFRGASDNVETTANAMTIGIAPDSYRGGHKAQWLQNSTNLKTLWNNDINAQVIGTANPTILNYGGSLTDTETGQIIANNMRSGDFWSDADAIANKAADEAFQIAMGRTLVPQPPLLTSFTPAFGQNGASVTIQGLNYTDVLDVLFNDVAAASFTVDSNVQITAVLPANGFGTGKIKVRTRGGQVISADDFTEAAAAPPTITSFNPTGSGPSQPVTVTGTGFVAGTTFTFNGVAASAVTINSETEAIATTPATAGWGDGPIAATNTNGTGTSSTNFAEVPAPTIDSFNPATAGVSTEITIGGTNFAQPITVRFNGVLASSATFDSAFQVRADTPATAGWGDGPITVETPTGTATSATDLIEQGAGGTVTLTSIVPDSGFIPEETLRLNGTGFLTVTVTDILLDGASADFFNVLNDTEIDVGVGYDPIGVGPVTLVHTTGQVVSTFNVDGN